MRRGFYDSSFFEGLKDESLRSAREVVTYLISLIQPLSVLGVGCGVGTWLAAFLAQHIEDIVGMDGAYVDRNQTMIPASRFVAADLKHQTDLRRQFDLDVTLEVAEYIPAASSETFVDTLIQHGKVILFSAAFPGQRGTNHINDQWPQYWKRLFEARDYKLVNCLRRRFWDNEGIAPV